MATPTAQTMPPLNEMDYRDLPGIRLIEWTPDGRGFVSASLSMNLRLHQEGEVVKGLHLDSGESKAGALERIRYVGLAADGEHAYVCAGTMVFCVNLLEERVEWWHRPRDHFGFISASPYVAVPLAHGGVAISTDTGSFEVRTLQGDLLRRRKENHSPHWAKLSREDGVIVGADGVSLSTWDAEHLTRTGHWGFSGHVYGMDLCPWDDLAAVRTDGKVTVRSWRTGETAYEFPVEPGLGFVSCEAKERLLAVGWGRGYALYTLDGRLVERSEYPDKRVLTASFAPAGEGASLALGFDDGSVEIALI